MFNMEDVLGMVNEEDAIQVINFVFEYLREETARTPLETLSVWVSCNNRDTLVTLRRAVDTADGKASLVCFRPPARCFYNFGVDIDFYFWHNQGSTLVIRIQGRTLLATLLANGHRSILAYDKKPPRDADLWSRERYALGLAVKRLFHIGDKARELCGAEQRPRHRERLLSQHRRAVLHDFFHVLQYNRLACRMLRRIESEQLVVLLPEVCRRSFQVVLTHSFPGGCFIVLPYSFRLSFHAEKFCHRIQRHLSIRKDIDRLTFLDSF